MDNTANTLRAMLNVAAFSKSEGDSGAIGLLESVLHELPIEGLYAVHVLAGDKHCGAHAEIQVSAASMTMQVDLDLSALAIEAESVNRTPQFELSPEGYLLCHASRSGAGYAVEIVQTGDEPKTVFDSRNLTTGDIYVLNLLTPGDYVLRNTEGEATATLKVGTVQDSRARPGELEPVEVQVSQDTFRPDSIEALPTQPVVFLVNGSARIIWEGVDGAVREMQEGPILRRMERGLGAEAPLASWSDVEELARDLARRFEEETKGSGS